MTTKSSWFDQISSVVLQKANDRQRRKIDVSNWKWLCVATAVMQHWQVRLIVSDKEGASKERRGKSDLHLDQKSVVCAQFCILSNVFSSSDGQTLHFVQKKKWTKDKKVLCFRAFVVATAVSVFLYILSFSCARVPTSFSLPHFQYAVCFFVACVSVHRAKYQHRENEAGNRRAAATTTICDMMNSLAYLYTHNTIHEGEVNGLFKKDRFDMRIRFD